MKKKYKLIHPYRHHSYHIVRGLLENGYDIEAIYGFYDKYNLNSIFNIKKLKGYYEKDITKVVKTYLSTNIYFILTKLKIISNEKYIEYFQRRAIKEIKKGDTIIVLQDYCQNIINYCIKENIDYIYDHIMPCGYKQLNLLRMSAKDYGFDDQYVKKYINEDKINRNLNNIENCTMVLNASYSTFDIAKEVILEKNKILLLPYGNNFNNFNSEVEIKEFIVKKYNSFQERKLKVLYVGSLSLIKGTNILIDIIEKCKFINIEFGVVGLPNQLKDDIFVSKLKEFNNVKYYGHIPFKEVKNIYLKYDVFLITSIIEGFGMVSLEAMGSAMPCIANKECKGIIENYYNGIVVDSIEADKYVDSIKLMYNKEKLITYSLNSYKLASQYSWSRYYNEINKFFDKE